jgi:succinoglycan biosynthesis protein ExoA
VFEETNADCLARPQPLDRLARGRWGKAIARARHSRLGHDPGSDIYGAGAAPTDPRSAGAAYRREVLRALGGYDERFDACEDVEFNHRVAEAGYRSYVHPDLAVDYRPREGLGPFWRQMLRYGRGRGRLFARHPRLVPWPILGATGLGVGFLIAAALMGKSGLALLAGGAGLWALALLVEGTRLGGLGGGGFRVAVALAVIQIGLTAGFWRGAAELPAYRPPATPVLS